MGATPFCLAQGLVAVLYLYTGYQVKRKKLHLQMLNAKKLAALAASIILTVYRGVTHRYLDGISESAWVLGFVVC